MKRRSPPHAVSVTDATYQLLVERAKRDDVSVAAIVTQMINLHCKDPK